MYFKNAWHSLEDSNKFQKWKKEHKESIFSYAFTSIEKELTDDWQIGFYDKKTDKIITFNILNSQVIDNRIDDVFKEPGSKMLEIDFDKVKLGIAEIIEKVNKFIKQKYPNEIINRKILILQNLPNLGTIWNITLISMSFNSLNVKIDAETGQIKSDKLTSLKDLISNNPKPL